MDSIIVKRDSDIIGKIPADERTVFLENPAGHISATFYHTSFIPIKIWDCIVYLGVNYYLNTYPEIRVSGLNDYIYLLDLLTHPTNRRGAFTHH
jgi:hypothetical protein